MADVQTTNETTNDVVGRRLTVVGIIGAVVVGVIWFGQWNSHQQTADDFGALFDPDPFNSTPYLIALAIAGAVVVLGLVLRGSNRR